MASLVLGAAGAFVGSFFGPIGTSIGWSIGSAIGAQLDKEDTFGPRLTDLKLQNSQYGTMIPIAYGAFRVTGQVIWQTDLVEHSETSSGKGGPEMTTYSYTASFAILLCEGPISAVTRVWADGRLVHDETSYETQGALDFVTYYGTEDQLPDPTIEIDKGVGNVPAHRGYAYVVFTDIDLADYGNRLPNFSFEVLTTTDTTIGLHEVARVSGLPIEWENGYSGVGVPWITSWPGSGNGQIVVKNMTIGGGHDYNNPDLSYSGSTNDPGDNEFNIEVWGPGMSFMWLYQSAGYVLIDGLEIPLWVYPKFAINFSTTDAALVGATPYSLDGTTTTTEREVASAAGIPDGLFIGGITLSTNKETFIVFTAATYGGAVNHWYRCINGQVTSDGAVTPTKAFGFLGYGAWANDEPQVNALENNGEWMWHVDGLDDERISVWHIDPVTGIFAEDAVAGSLDLNDGNLATKPSIRVMKEGFCGVVMSAEIVVVSRLPTYSANGVTLSDVVSDLCDRSGLLTAQINVDQLEDDFVQGYVLARQGAVRGAIGQLQAGYFFDAVESEEVVRFVRRNNEAIVTIDQDDLAAAGEGEGLPALVAYTRQQEAELPRVVAVTYLNFDEDYQQGSQPAKRDVTISEMESDIGLAIVMSPMQARRIAETTLYMAWLERERFKLRLPRKYVHYEPTDVVECGDWTMRLTNKVEQPGGVIEFDAVATSAKTYIPAQRGVPGLGFVPGTPPIKQLTDLMLLDIPLVDEGDAVTGYYVAVAGKTSTAWTGTVLFRSKDAGVNYAQVATFNVPSVMGTARTVLGDWNGINTFDEASTVQVELTAGAAQTLESLSEEMVLGGANLALIGNEMLQYKNAVLVAGSPVSNANLYELSGLLRSRRGTEWAMGEHVADERFVLLSTVYDQAASPADIGQQHLFKAVTDGNTLAATEAVPFTLHAVRLRCYAPVLVGGGSDAAGDITINWTRRTRLGGAWLNFTEVPLGESFEQYVVQIWEEGYDDCARIIIVDNAQTATYTAAQQVTDFGDEQQIVYVTVGQVGAYGLGKQESGTVTGLAAGSLNSAVITPISQYPVEWIVPPSGTTVDQNDMENFAGLMDTDRQLAYKYATLAPLVTTNWYGRHQFQIIDRFFNGDQWAWALWVQDAEYNRPFLTFAETAALFALAAAARS